MYKFLTKALTLATVLPGMALCSCSKLSDEAKKIVGTYYNTELSQTQPVMELRSDASCLIRAIRPGVLSYSVEGTWNVERDSLILQLEPASLTWEGDSMMIGDIPKRNARKIVSYTDFSIQLEQDGATYLYKRQAQH